MFDAALYQHLTADATLTGLISTYNGEPAIFKSSAPEDADLPYLVWTIERYSVDDGIIENMVLDIDYYEYCQHSTSWANALAVSTRLEQLLDRAHLQDARYDTIRIRSDRGFEIQGPDPRLVHYNTRFTARGSRKYWIDNQ